MNEKMRYTAIVSDQHWGDGGRLEDFHADPQMAALIEQVALEGRASGAPADLVLNGDICDLLRCSPYEHGPWHNAIGKLQGVGRAHRALIEGLRRFVAAGNRLVLLPGNHDVELAIPDVQEAFAALVAPPGDAAARARVHFPNESPLPPHFGGRATGPFVHRAAGLHVQHGNQFDPLNAFDHGHPFEDAEAQRVALPWGSRFVLELFNDLSARYPFIDKLQPHEAAFLVLYVVDPRAVRARVPALAALGAQLYPELRRRHRSARAAGAGAKGGLAANLDGEDAFLAWLGQFADDLEAIDRGAGVVQSSPQGSKGLGEVPRHVSVAAARVLRAALAALTARLGSLTDEDGYATPALALATAEDAEVVVLGHTHGLRDITRNGRRYLNCGTWIGLVDLDLNALAEGEPDYPEIVARLRDPGCFRPVERCSFVEIAYPQGRLKASLKVLRDGAWLPEGAS
jgi:UDP-2,3-diacylglucosamine pyrophosphatase LpxH